MTSVRHMTRLKHVARAFLCRCFFFFFEFISTLDSRIRHERASELARRRLGYKKDRQ